MDELDLFATARPEVPALDDDALARIRALAFAPADDTASRAPHDPPAVAPVLALGRGDRGRANHSRRWMLAAAAVGLLVAGVVVAQHGGSPTHSTSASDAGEGGAPAPTGAISPAPGTGADATTPPGTDGAAAPPPTEVTFPRAPSAAENFLIAGVDNGSCVDPDSPYAGAFGDRTTLGERADTIMVLRLDPTTHHAAILSFPRDLWVDIAGDGVQGRINATFTRDDPQQLIDTIFLNFGIVVDHFVQVDFCAFTTIVDAIGGVAVPFEFPTRDRNTGIDIAEPGCVTFDGDAALAYVRSRHYQYFMNGQWRTDATSDLGRISRQQDFVRRLLATIGARDLFDVDTISGLIEAVQDNVVVDSGLTITDLLGLAGELADLDPASITGYEIEAVGRTIAEQAVLEPTLDSASMQVVLAMFRGDAALGADPAGNGTGPAPTDPSVAPAPITEPPITEPQGTISPSTIAPNTVGVVPPAAVSC